MQTIARPNDILLFHCGHCSTELSVPITLQGVEGPCPTCQQVIKAPECALPMLKPGLFFPPSVREESARPPHGEPAPLPQNGRQTMPSPPPVLPEKSPANLTPEFYQNAAPVEVQPRNAARLDSPGFQPRLGMPSQPDSLAKGELGKRKKSTAKRLEKAATGFLESSLFRAARVAVLVILGAGCAGIFLYMKDRQWVIDLPWRPAIPSKLVRTSQATPSPVPAPSLPATSDAEENPFLVEDRPGADGASPPVMLVPVPEPGSVPVGARPIPAGNN